MKNISFIIVLILFCVSCSDDESFGNSNEFQSYLRDAHKIELNDSLHFFIIINLDDCHQCIRSLFSALDSSKINPKRITYIGSFNGKSLPPFVQDLKMNYTIVFENRFQFFKSKLGYLGNVVIKTKNKKIIQLYQIDNDNDLKNYFGKEKFKQK